MLRGGFIFNQQKSLMFLACFSAYKLYESLYGKFNFSDLGFSFSFTSHPTSYALVQYKGYDAPQQQFAAPIKEDIQTDEKSSMFLSSPAAQNKLNVLAEKSNLLFMLQNREKFYTAYQALNYLVKNINARATTCKEFYNEDYDSKYKGLAKLSGFALDILPKTSIILDNDAKNNELYFGNQSFTKQMFTILAAYKKLLITERYVHLYNHIKQYQDPKTSQEEKTSIKEMLGEQGVIFNQDGTINDNTVKLHASQQENAQFANWFTDITREIETIKQDFIKSPYIIQKIIARDGDISKSYKKFIVKAHPDQLSHYPEYLGVEEKTGCSPSSSHKEIAECVKQELSKDLAAFQTEFHIDSLQELNHAVYDYCGNPDHQSNLFCSSDFTIELSALEV